MWSKLPHWLPPAQHDSLLERFALPSWLGSSRLSKSLQWIPSLCLLCWTSWVSSHVLVLLAWTQSQPQAMIYCVNARETTFCCVVLHRLTLECYLQPQNVILLFLNCLFTETARLFLHIQLQDHFRSTAYLRFCTHTYEVLSCSVWFPRCKVLSTQARQGFSSEQNLFISYPDGSQANMLTPPSPPILKSFPCFWKITRNKELH